MEKYVPVVVIKELSETDKILTALEKKHSALKNAGKEDESGLGEVITSIKKKIKEAYNGNG